MPEAARPDVRRPASGAEPQPGPKTVALFVTCLVDMIRPSVGFAAVKLLEDAGYRVEVPSAQTCCGQPAFNSGDFATARDLAKQVIDAFAGYSYVVAPSGSCGGMLKTHLAELFADDPAWKAKAEDLSARMWELVSFLTDVAGVKAVKARYAGTAAYHDSCSGLRELGVRAQPRALLASVEGLSVKELPATRDVCCGFGGTFCVKYPAISDRMVEDKIKDVQATGADTLLAGDLGCLMNMAGKLSRAGSAIKVRHVAEVLAGEDFTGPDAAPPLCVSPWASARPGRKG
ncbi:MAG: (Fe-S)-binding protein [Alphaproteobacteria bacterium]|nr:(Fe-S)-binding protein [Alphaproteobacteria bacterium]